MKTQKLCPQCHHGCDITTTKCPYCGRQFQSDAPENLNFFSRLGMGLCVGLIVWYFLSRLGV